MFQKSSIVDMAFIVAANILLLSPLATIVLNFGGKYVIEAGLVPYLIFLYVYRPLAFAELAKTARSPVMLGFTALLGVLFGIGAIEFDDVIGPYTDFRACYIMFFCFMFFYQARTNNPAKLKTLVWLCLTYLPFGLVYEIANSHADTAKSIVSIFVNVILCHVASRQQRPLPLIVAFGLMTFVAILSGFRTYWLVSAFTILTYLCFYVAVRLQVRQYKLAYGILIAIIGITTAVVLSGVVTSYFKSSQSKYIQSIAKTQAYVDAVTQGSSLPNSDAVRTGYYICAIEYAPDFLLPHGLGSKSVPSLIHPFFNRFAAPANTLDCGFFFLVYHFGYFLSAIIVGGLVIAISKRLKFSQIKGERYYVLAGLLPIVAYLNGAAFPFTIIQIGAFFGAYLGLLLNPYLDQVTIDPVPELSAIAYSTYAAGPAVDTL
jgi:hypothetical protein